MSMEIVSLCGVMTLMMIQPFMQFGLGGASTRFLRLCNSSSFGFFSTVSDDLAKYLYFAKYFHAFQSLFVLDVHMGGDGSSSRRRAAGALGLETALDEGVEACGYWRR